MKKLFCLVLLSSVTFAKADPYRLHKTVTGKYYSRYIEVPTEGPWNDELQKDFDERVDALIDQICDESKLIAIAQTELNRQKEISKVSGTQDLMALHHAGAMIYDHEMIKKGEAQIFKDSTGSEFKDAQCLEAE